MWGCVVGSLQDTRQSPAAIEPWIVGRPVSGLMSGVFAVSAAFPRKLRSGIVAG